MERRGVTINSVYSKHKALITLECCKKAESFVKQHCMTIYNFIKHTRLPTSLVLKSEFSNINKTVLEIKRASSSKMAVKLISDGVVIIDQNNSTIEDEASIYIPREISKKMEEAKKEIEKNTNCYNKDCKEWHFYCEDSFNDFLNETLTFHATNLKEKEIYISNGYNIKAYKEEDRENKSVNVGFLVTTISSDRTQNVGVTKKFVEEEDNFVYAIDWLLPIKRTYNLIYTGREY